MYLLYHYHLVLLSHSSLFSFLQSLCLKAKIKEVSNVNSFFNLEDRVFLQGNLIVLRAVGSFMLGIFGCDIVHQRSKTSFLMKIRITYHD